MHIDPNLYHVLPAADKATLNEWLDINLAPHKHSDVADLHILASKSIAWVLVNIDSTPTLSAEAVALLKRFGEQGPVEMADTTALGDEYIKHTA